MNYKTIIYARGKDGVALVTLNRPKKLNAMNPQMMWEIVKVLEEMEEDNEVKSVIFTGAGRAFSSGTDITGMELELLEKGQQAEYDTMLNEFKATIGEDVEDLGTLRIAMVLDQKVFDFEKPTIAAVNGYALGIGMCFSQACDLVYASEDATMGFLFIRNAIGTTDIGTTYLTPRSIGMHKAKELMMLGNEISARDAEKLNLVNKVFPPDRLMPEAKKVARRFAKGPIEALKSMKHVINSQLKDDILRAIKLELKAASISFTSTECLEAIIKRGNKEEPYPEFVEE